MAQWQRVSTIVEEVAGSNPAGPANKLSVWTSTKDAVQVICGHSSLLVQKETQSRPLCTTRQVSIANKTAVIVAQPQLLVV